jgi:nicotinate-nucleotide adenylyltransferase
LSITRVGVLGGTFNPIHYGHLHIARYIRQIFSLSQVHFVVATVPPHKPLQNLIALTHRYAMVSLATSGEPAFIPSLIELEPQASPFSVDTMRKLERRVRPENGILYFIAGGDSLLEMKTWRKSETLLNSYNFVFVVRPGIKTFDPRNVLPEKTANRMRDLTGLGRVHMQRRIAEEKTRENRIYIIDIKAPDISATQIRRLVNAGKPIHRMVPRPVCEYIRKLQLYGGR